MRDYCEQAKALAKETGIPHCVVELDYENGREVFVVPDYWTDDPEFAEGCGEVIATYHAHSAVTA